MNQLTNKRFIDFAKYPFLSGLLTGVLGSVLIVILLSALYALMFIPSHIFHRMPPGNVGVIEFIRTDIVILINGCVIGILIGVIVKIVTIMRLRGQQSYQAKIGIKQQKELTNYVTCEGCGKTFYLEDCHDAYCSDCYFSKSNS